MFIYLSVGLCVFTITEVIHGFFMNCYEGRAWSEGRKSLHVGKDLDKKVFIKEYTILKSPISVYFQ